MLKVTTTAKLYFGYLVIDGFRRNGIVGAIGGLVFFLLLFGITAILNLGIVGLLVWWLFF